MKKLDFLDSKKILIIAPSFFGYDKAISKILSDNGATVKLYNDRPSNSFLTKSLIRINRKLLSKKTNDYYDRIIEENAGTKFDEILVIRGEALSASRIETIKRTFPSARLKLYLWDSMKYNPNAKNIYTLFHNVYSFDREDTFNYNGIEFLPLFYSRHFKKVGHYEEQQFNFDACFIGTVHTDRYKVLEKIHEHCKENGIRLFMYCFYPSKTLNRIRSLIDPGFRAFSKAHIKFESIPLEKVVEVFNESKCIIDINRPDQQGLTMRSIETFGSRRKLVTTNSDIQEYDIYNDNNMLVLDRHAPSLPISFLKSPFQIPDSKMLETYSIESWISQIFGHQHV